MFKSERFVADLLFAVQFGGALWFGKSQTTSMLTANEGVIITWFSSMLVFFTFNLILAIGAHRKERSRATLQTLVIYITWLVLNVIFIGIMIYRGTGI